ncbi:hypothetical protein BC827DRAFT_1270799 [Russula dissimulans]|nr:hypothetical protein BC827DRAFT_1270799 [Russula dissimulans]
MAPRKKRSRHKHPAIVQSCQSQTVSKYFRLITIDTLPDDILLEVFDQYRSLSAGDWSHLQGWYKLAHTCQRWRLLVFTSSLRLNLQLRCTFRTPVVDMLNHFPLYPLVLDYGPRILKTWTTEDQHDLLFALQHLSRAKEIMLSAPQSVLAEMTAAMVEAAPRLEHLTLHSQSTEFVLPRSFLNGDAPQLRHLILTSVSLATLGPLLSSTTSLVSLVLERVPSPAYFSPTSLVAHIRLMPHLEKLAIGFLSTVPRPGFRGEPFLPRGQMDRVTLPALAQLVYRGVSAYIEALLARVETPLLQDVDITLFNQLTLRIPHICAFFRDLEVYWPARACIDFTETSAHLLVSAPRSIEPADISLAVFCPRLDFQVSAMVQICSGLSDTGVGSDALPLSVEELTLGFHQSSLPEEWRDEVDPALWRALLTPFRRVRTLRLHAALAVDFERALCPDRLEAAADADADVGEPALVTVDEELEQELILPELRTVVLLNDNDILPISASKALHTFFEARDHVGRPITVKYRNSTLISNGKSCDVDVYSTRSVDWSYLL